MVLRRAFTAMGLLALFVAPCSNICTGWMSSPKARMACCVGKSSAEAMMCCASAEGRRNTDLSAATAVAALPAPEPVALKLASGVIAEIGATPAVIESLEPLAPDSERHILLSVFLI